MKERKYDYKKTHQTKTIRKKFLSLDECANRFGCTLDDMLHYLDNGLILACANLETLSPATWFKGFSSPTEKERFLASSSFSEQLKLMEDCQDKFPHLNDWEKKGEVPNRGRYLLLDVAIHTRQCTFQNITYWWYGCDRVNKKLPYIDKQGHGVGFCSLSTPITIPAHELFIYTEQIERFECEYGLLDVENDNQTADTKPDKIDIRKEKTYLRFVNLMVKTLDLSEKPFTAAEQLSSEAGRLGVKFPFSPDTIVKVLKAARNID